LGYFPRALAAWRLCVKNRTARDIAPYRVVGGQRPMARNSARNAIRSAVFSCRSQTVARPVGVVELKRGLSKPQAVG